MDVGELLWPHPRERADGVVRGVGRVGDGLGTRGVLEDFDLHFHKACEGGWREGDHVAVCMWVWVCGHVRVWKQIECDDTLHTSIQFPDHHHHHHHHHHAHLLTVTKPPRPGVAVRIGLDDDLALLVSVAEVVVPRA